MRFRWFMIGSILLLMVFATAGQAGIRIRCASTTSTHNSGLFDHLLPLFEKKTDIKVDVIAVGTGAAISIGKRGDADLVLVHAKEQELKALREGFFVKRRDVMYNDFVIIGPSVDPAGIRGTRSASEALERIAEVMNRFVSRGDGSGTHTKELSLWKQAGVNPKGTGWYLEVGQGMAKTQRIANEKRSYTLTDRGTWLATRDRDRLDMAIMVEGDPLLFNQYGVMAVDPDRHKHIQYREAVQFIEWLVSREGQQAIASYRDKRGNRLFIPNAK